MSKREIERPDWRDDDDAFERIVPPGFERAVRKAVVRHHRDGRSVPI